MLTAIRSGNTTSYLVRCNGGWMLVDTGWAGTLSELFRALKKAGVRSDELRYAMCTHYHPDHMGVVGDVQNLGATLVVLDVQADHTHDSDHIFAREGIAFTPVTDSNAIVVTCDKSRAYLSSIGIDGEVVHTPSHSPDSICLLLDDGECAVGDLRPLELVGDEDPQLSLDWELLLERGAERPRYAHWPSGIEVHGG